MAARTLDLKGLSCPLPILKTRKALGEIAVGEELEVFATDPGAETDFPTFCKATGNMLVEHAEDAGVFRFLIRRGA